MSSTALALAFAAATTSFNLPEGLLPAICYVESKHVIRAINVDDGGSSSVGVCQLKLATARLMGYTGTVSRLQTDAATNAYYAAKYIRYQLDRYGGDSHKAVSAYNAGTHRVNDLGQTKNRKYVEKVYRAWTEYK